MNKARPTFLLLPLILSACALGRNEFACPGGVTERGLCLSARDVYQATENADTVRPPPDATDAAPHDPPQGIPVPYPARAPGQEAVAVPAIDQPLPIRSQAGILRIWVAPWEDQDGDLHADGYLYTEVEARRWNLGARVRAPRGGLTPLGSRSGRDGADRR
jgi:conjugal transfer pilus assembly protein TraV